MIHIWVMSVGIWWTSFFAKPVPESYYADPEPEAMRGMVERHNYWRREFGLPDLVWSDDLAKFAQQWANKLQKEGCKMYHRQPNVFGENLYWSSGMKSTPKQVVDAWASEKAFYDFKKFKCKQSWEKCGHYTQIIWENTRRVGCAMATCGDKQIWVCNYDPPGNYKGQKPFTPKPSTTQKK